jgi:hypothetical protein
MIQYADVDPFIRCYPDMIDAALCQAMIQKFDADPRRQAGRVLAYNAAGIKESVDLEIRVLPDWEPLCRAFDRSVARSLRRYRTDVPNFNETQRGMFRETGYQIQCYQPNGRDSFLWHSDVSSRPSCDRVLALIAYLNTVEVGGETEFRAQELKIAPARGSILWFPPTFPYVHRGNVPLSGPKYIVTCFLTYPK